MNSRKINKQAGFTLVELIVVIIILGILAAVALPKFMDVTDKAHESAVKGALGGLGSGVALFHAQWVANGHSAATNNVVGFGSDNVDSNDNGWPIKTNGGVLTSPANADDCLEVWEGIMQSPPPASTTANAEDYYVTLVGGGNTCRFEYEINSNNPRYRIEYNTNTGDVVLN